MSLSAFPVGGSRDDRGRFVTDYRHEANPLLMLLISRKVHNANELDKRLRRHKSGYAVLPPADLEKLLKAIDWQLVQIQRLIASYSTATREWWKPWPADIYGKDLQG